MSLKIGALAERTGTNAPMIRYYESIGLLPQPHRHDGGQRTYSEADVKRLTFIRRCREFGFPIGKVRTLVGLTQDPARSCTEAREQVQQLVRSEQTCCAFLAFAVHDADNGVHLIIELPETARGLADNLFASFSARAQCQTGWTCCGGAA